MRYVAPACSVSEEVTLNCKLIDKQLSLITSMKQITCVVISPTYRAVVGLEHADKQTDGLDFLSCFHFIHRIQLYKSVTSVFTYYMRFSQHEDSTENIYTKITSDMQLTRGPLWAKKIRVSEVFFFPSSFAYIPHRILNDGDRKGLRIFGFLTTAYSWLIAWGVLSALREVLLVPR